MFNVSIDGNPFESPDGLDDLVERIAYESDLAIYFNQLDGNLVFWGDSYNYLRNNYDNNICTKSDIVITDTRTNDTYEGVIYMNDMDWNLSKRSVTVRIVSDKYIELIRINQNIKVQLGVALSKNQTAISSTSGDVDFLNPTATGFITRSNCFRIFEVFQELIEFMSDGELSFTSDYFSQTTVIGNPAYGWILTAEHLRTDEDETPLISYEEFFGDMNKLHNLAASLEGTTVRIEPKSYYRDNEITTTIPDINELEQELDRDKFYASVRMGSSKEAEGYGYLPKLSYNGFQQEQFFMEGQCNINSELDLQLNTLITDTNIIQDIQPIANGGTDNDEYDRDIILVKTFSNNVTETTEKPLSGTDFYYNNFYTNAMVGERWSGEYLFSIIQLLETVNQLVFANLTNDQTDTTSPPSIWFSPDDDSTPPYFDTGGDYQIGSIPLTTSYTDTVGYFEAPSDMIVTFEVDFYLSGSYWQTRLLISILAVIIRSVQYR